jgi:starch-binding outer membrane protein, SusD/RagB family
MRSYIKLSVALSLSCLVLYACKKDFLERAPLGSLDPGTLSSPAGVKGLLIGAYSLLDGFGGAGGGFATAASNWVFGGVASDDAYKGSDPGDQADIVSIETYSANSSNPYFNDKWRHLYDAVQRSNDVLRVMATVEGLSDAEKAVIEGEAKFLRAHYHFEAKRIWNMVPYIDETVTYGNGNFLVPNDKDIWPNIEADLKAAVASLPATQPAVGRANSWAAKAYLAKVYMYQKKYAEAKALFDDVIANGVTASGKKYALVNFFDNFNPETKNSAESVFSAQMSVNDNSGGNNGNWGDVLNFPYNGGPGGCCGFYQPSQSLVNSYRVDAAGLPFIDNFNSVNVKNDQGLKSTDPFTPETAALDPRLDMTVGRRGLPYLDWGLHPGNDWIRDQANGGPYAPIKNIYAKRQQEAYSDKSFWSSGITANNYTIIRFADVLLMSAEAEVEVGSLEKARELVNQVRARAANPAGWVKTYVDPADPSKGYSSTPAANYNIGLYPAFATKEFARQAVRFERKLELAMEGHRFFDLVRYGIAAEELNKYISVEKARRSYLNNATFTKGQDEYYPIPSSQIDLSKGALKQNPGQS